MKVDENNLVEVVELKSGAIYKLTPENAGDAVMYGASVETEDGQSERLRFEYLSVLVEQEENMKRIAQGAPKMDGKATVETTKKYVPGKGVVDVKETPVSKTTKSARSKTTTVRGEKISPDAEKKLAERVKMN